MDTPPGSIVKHQMGRPIKVEGNPQHPASLGATDVFGQAQLLEFYDPERAAEITEHGLPADWQLLQTAMLNQRAKIAANHGAGLRILTGTITSPTLARQSMRCSKAIPLRAGTNGSRCLATTSGKEQLSRMARRSRACRT